VLLIILISNFTCNKTLIGCLPHIVLEKVFKYSTKAAGFKVSIISMPLKKNNDLDKLLNSHIIIIEITNFNLT